MRIFVFFIYVLFSLGAVEAQSISGVLTEMPNALIRLEGFNGTKTYVISKVTTNAEGFFKMNYAAKDRGMGYLIADGIKPRFVVLSGEDIEIEGYSLAYPESIQVIKGNENLAFDQYAQEQPRREQVLNAWNFLEGFYQQDSLFRHHIEAIRGIANEKEHLNQASKTFIESLSEDSYVRWFLPTRRLVSSLNNIATYRPAEIPEALEALRSLNYADDRLYKSGLFKDALEGHIWFIENSSGELEKVYEDMKQSIDLMVAQLSGHQDRFTEVTDFLFHLLEQRSLFPAAEHLAIKALEEQSCTLPGKLANQLEGYRKLKKGSTAPNISFCENTYFPNDSNPKDLKAFSSPYKLVVFAASWCTHCQEVMPKLVKYYPQWKEKGLDIVFVSLDDDLQAFSSFAGSFPFISTCDLKKWDGKAALDYHLFGTPTFYLLKDNLEIVLKPHSVEQIDVWVNYSLPKD